MSQINRVPFGLQYLLGSKNFGVNPSQLAQTTIPEIEQLPFLSAELLDADNAVDTGVTAPLTLIEEVPSGEAWLVEQFVCNSFCPATRYMRMNGSIQIPAPTGTFNHWTGVLVLDGPAASGATGAIGGSIPFVPSGPFIALAGTQFRFSCLATSGTGNGEMRVHVLYRRLTI